MDMAALLSELDSIVEQEIASTSRKQAEASAKTPSPLVPAQVQAKKIEDQLKEKVRRHQTKCAEGIGVILNTLQELSLPVEPLVEDLRSTFGKLESMQVSLDLGQKCLEGASWKELLGIQEATLQGLYLGAKSLVDSARYQEAEAAFIFLTLLDACQPVFWQQLGTCQYHLGDFDQAIETYTAATACDQNDFWPFIYLACCFEKKNDFVQALSAIEKAQALSVQSGQKDPDLALAIRDKWASLKNS
jgi:tetratricopeptide (TPR) repeat protein